MRLAAVFWVAWGAVGCAASYPHPMMASDLVGHESSDALVAYLEQPDASPSVCDPRVRGPHLAHFEEGTWTALVEGMTSGKIESGLWRRCVDRTLDAVSPQQAAPLLDAVVQAYRALVKTSALETSPTLQSRLAALQAFYIERPNGLDGHPDVVGPALDEIRKAFVDHRRSRVADRHADELVAIVELEAGRYGGRPVDRALLDRWQANGDETLLRRCFDRLPSNDLRNEAGHRLVRVRIATSPFAEVRALGAEVEARVMQQGTNRVSVLEHPPSSASLDRSKLPANAILVRQDVVNQSATLVGRGARNDVSVLPSLPLQSALWVYVTGISRPITLCQPPRMLDPSPCLGAEDVKIESPLVTADRDGAFQLVETISALDAAALARAQHLLVLPINVGGLGLTRFAWPLHFEQPDNLMFAAENGAGPVLRVTIDNTDPSLFSFTVVVGSGTVARAVVEKHDLPSFRVVSRGAPGASGSDGTSGADGSPGWDGTSASCPSSSGSEGTRGGDGGRGEDGGDGGSGSAGADIQVQVDCGAAGCSPILLASLRGIIRSEGGPGGNGGRGGSGGRGGRGGSGGSGTSCIDGAGAGGSLAGGSSGSTGTDGSSGTNGRDGASGKNGQVHFVATPPMQPAAPSGSRIF